MEFTGPRLLAVPHKRHHKARMGSKVEVLLKPEIKVETEITITHEDNTQDDLSTTHSCSVSSQSSTRTSSTTQAFTNKSNTIQPRGAAHQGPVDKHAGMGEAAEEDHAMSSLQRRSNSLHIAKKDGQGHSWAHFGLRRTTEESDAPAAVHGSTRIIVPPSPSQNRRHSAYIPMERVGDAFGLQRSRSVGGPSAYGIVRNEERDLPPTDSQW